MASLFCLPYHISESKLEHLWKKKTKIIPVVIGVLGAVSGRFKNFVHLDLKGEILQKYTSQQYSELLQF